MSAGQPLPGTGRDGDTYWQRELREQFPILTADPELAYLDSAATSQKPRAVLEAVQTYLTTSNANAGRGTYPWANRTTHLVESTRERVKEFLRDPEPERSAVHFTSGTTEGLRTVARDWLVPYLGDGDEILVPFADHRAQLDPWLEARRLLAERGIDIRVRALPYQEASGDYDHRALGDLVGPRTRFVAATHVHHVYGGDMNVHRIREAVGPEVPICLDAAQSIGHLPVHLDDPALDVDFVVFSGHKAMALPGTGAVWARNARGPLFRPEGWQGTPNTVGIVSLRAALDWLHAAGPDRIARWTSGLATRLTDRLRHLGPYEILGCPSSLAADSALPASQRRHGIVTFRHRDIPSDDLGFILYSHGFMVRADSLCQAGAGERDGSVRVSLHVYNTEEEIDRLLTVLASLT
ncbi:aminotransferase class V-fold PLP-dependent enzyme [Streptomyces nodosus]|uniref:Aminotransferase class V-fold PLP-dependent enzyme n=1 Tax=Streptomyces nodosus TaxID=40318 RepID=A0A0B5DG07_9ACTN|nr:aminotransferase class V-fold PLP-dependent enzyme [Streptomyces nodosus]AJE39376.1 cysteine desulfurase [Streptomyces nodosus]MBB4790291.1 cysteine desulfurase/selenocysteine lyase [Streptomyces nodosus]QEV37958.1 aminotransferase class V-fold PLP-dependent enzyme [Streptomyces nodosus]